MLDLTLTLDIDIEECPGADLEVRHSNTGKSVLFYKMKLCFCQKLHLEFCRTSRSAHDVICLMMIDSIAIISLSLSKIVNKRLFNLMAHSQRMNLVKKYSNIYGEILIDLLKAFQ